VDVRKKTEIRGGLLKVWLVYIEYQADTPSIEGVFANKQAAEKRAREIVESHRNDRKQVWGEEAADEDEANWDVDVHVDELTVKT
jgi:hypothetical protein